MGCILTSPLLLLAAAFGYWAWRRWTLAARLAEGTEVDGRVVGFEQRQVEFNPLGRSDGGTPRTVRLPVVEFRDEAGGWTRLVGPEGTVGRALRANDRVKVRYPRGEPEQAVVVGENNRLIAGAISAIALAFLFSWLRLTC